MKLKLCSKCNKKRDTSEFAINKATLDGLDYWCKECRSAYHKVKYPRKMKKIYIGENEKECRRCNLIKLNSEFRKYKGKTITYCTPCMEKYGFTRNASKYGINTEEYFEMLDAQDGVCYICKNKEKGNKKRLSVDHDHNCHPSGSGCKKCIRKLLCHNCNTALGNAQDSIEILEKMINYLKEHKN
jgi:hypothetical protein